MSSKGRKSGVCRVNEMLWSAWKGIASTSFSCQQGFNGHAFWLSGAEFLDSCGAGALLEWFEGCGWPFPEIIHGLSAVVSEAGKKRLILACRYLDLVFEI